MAEESFPILEAPLSDTQWKSIARGFGTGVLDEGGNPYNLTRLDNISNTAVVDVDTLKGFNHAVVSGFYHKMDAPETVTMPAVSTTTKYYIVLQYNPFNTNGYVKLAVLTTLDKSNGKDYLVLWEVIRQPNQLLTDATLSKKRPILAPTIIVDTPDALPDARMQLWGTRAFAYKNSQEYRASYNGRWVIISPHRVSLLSPPGWSVSSDAGGISVIPTTDGFMCSAYINMVREGSSYTIGNDFHTAGTVIPEEYRPNEHIWGLATSGNYVLEVRVSTSGAVAFRGRGTNFLMERGKGISFTVSWFTSKIYS